MEIIDIDKSLNELYKNSMDLIENARGITAKQINIIEIMTFYSIGRWIMEEKQQGKGRTKLVSEWSKGFQKLRLSSMEADFQRIH